MSEYTKGPWEAKNLLGNNTGFTTIGPADCNTLILLARDHVRQSNIEHQANANLIAASPTLYEACKEIQRFYNGVGTVLKYEMAIDAYNNSATKDRVDAAIASAEGK